MNVSYSVKQLTKALNNLQQTHIDSKQLQELIVSSTDDKRAKIVAEAIEQHIERIEVYKQIIKQSYPCISDTVIFNEILPVVSFNRMFGHTSGIIKWAVNNPNIKKGIIVSSVFYKNELNIQLREAGAQNFKIATNCDVFRGVSLDAIIVHDTDFFDNTQKNQILTHCRALDILPIAVGCGGWNYKE